MATEPRGDPEWPELACCTMSTARKRSVLTHNSSKLGGASVVESVIECALVAHPSLGCDRTYLAQRTKTRAEQLGWPIDYGFRFWPWHPGCWHWQVISEIRFASAQDSLQYAFPSGGTQLQAGCAHLDGVVMGTPFVVRALLSGRNGVSALSEWQVLPSGEHLSSPNMQHRTRGNKKTSRFAHHGQISECHEHCLGPVTHRCILRGASAPH